MSLKSVDAWGGMAKDRGKIEGFQRVVSELQELFFVDCY